MRQLFLVCTALLGGVGLLVARGQPEPPVPSAQEVRKIIGDQQKYPWREVVELGERVYPALEAILNDPTVTESEASQVFFVLSNTKGDRRRFVPHAVRWLSTPAAR